MWEPLAAGEHQPVSVRSVMLRGSCEVRGQNGPTEAAEPSRSLRCVQLTLWCLKGTGSSGGTESKGLKDRAYRCRTGLLQTSQAHVSEGHQSRIGRPVPVPLRS